MPRHSSLWAAWSVSVLTTLAIAQPTQALRNVRVGDKAPPLSVTDLAGKPIDMAACKGKPLLVLFVRPDQERSVQAMRIAQRIHRDHADTPLKVVVICTKPDEVDAFKRIVSTNGFEFVAASDPDRNTYGDFGLLVSPTALLIDAEGVLRFELPHIPPNYEQKLRIHADLLAGRNTLAEHDKRLAQMEAPSNKLSGSIERNLGLARSLLHKGRHEQAIAVLTKLEGDHPSPQIAITLATAYLEMGKLDEAGRRLDPLSELKPAPAGLHLALGRLERLRSNDEKAVSHLEEALEHTPDKARILYELGLISEKGGKRDEALDYYRRALAEVFGEDSGSQAGQSHH